MKLKVILYLVLIYSFVNCKGQNDNTIIFDQVWNTVNEHFYDPNFNGTNWDEKREEYKPQIENCKNTDTLFTLLNKMLFELNSSHCGVGLTSELINNVSPYIFKNGEVGIDVRIVENQIIISKVLKNSEAEIANFKPGYIIEKIDGLTIVDIEKLVKYKPPINNRNRKFHFTSEVLRLIYGQSGSSVKIDYLDEYNQPNSKVLTRTVRLNGSRIYKGMPIAYLESNSYFISKNIAYLTFNTFNSANIEQVLTNLETVNNSKGLIIDLRGNDGGSIEEMKLLLGRFVSKRENYGTYMNRNEQNEDFIEPIGTKYQGKVVLLVDEMSISGAENMAGIFKQLNLGKVMGNQTPGQMLWGNGYSINDSINLVIPIYKLKYSNGFNPENNGIKPDIEIKLNRNDLLNGNDSQLNMAINYLNKLLVHSLLMSTK